VQNINSKDLVAIQSDSNYLLFHKGFDSSGSGVTAAKKEELPEELQMVCPHEKLLQEQRQNASTRTYLFSSPSPLP
jgi:hypothetical protein